MSENADPIAALRSILADDTDVADLVDGRIAIEIPQRGAKNMPQPCIVVKPSGGPHDGGFQELGRLRVDVICYGDTIGRAWQVFLTASPVLKQLRRTVSENVLIHGVELLSNGSTGIDPVTQWPTTYSSWLVTAAEIPAD